MSIVQTVYLNKKCHSNEDINSVTFVHNVLSFSWLHIGNDVKSYSFWLFIPVSVTCAGGSRWSWDHTDGTQAHPFTVYNEQHCTINQPYLTPALLTWPKYVLGRSLSVQRKQVLFVISHKDDWWVCECVWGQGTKQELFQMTFIFLCFLFQADGCNLSDLSLCSGLTLGTLCN